MHHLSYVYQSASYIKFLQVFLKEVKPEIRNLRIKIKKNVMCLTFYPDKHAKL